MTQYKATSDHLLTTLFAQELERIAGVAFVPHAFSWQLPLFQHSAGAQCAELQRPH